MKTILKITAVAAWMLLLSSCESLLDTTNYMTKTTADFPSNAGEVEQMVTGVYNNLNATAASADSLLTDLKAHPKRYVHFSIFGKKDK